MSTVGQLVVNLLGNTAHFRREFSVIPGFLGGITGRLTGMLGSIAGIGSIGTGIKLAADAEQMQVAFETMLGSAEKARSMLGALRDYATKSPFTQIATVEAARLLLNYGVAADQIMPTMKMLGDIAGGDEQRMHGLALAFGQMSATGRLMGQDLNQMINAGFNPLMEISKRTGESMGALKARMEAGGISIEEVRDALVDATSAGGRFFGMSDRQAQTLSGRFSTMKDEVNETLRKIGEQLSETFNFTGLVEFASASLAEFRTWISQTGSDIVVLGGAVFGFVTALVAVRTAIQAATIATAIWRTVSSPAGIAMLVAGLVGANLAVRGLEDMFTASSNRAQELSRSAAAAAASVRSIAAASEAAGKAFGSAGPLARVIEGMRHIEEERAKGAKGNYAASLDKQMADFQKQFDQATSFKDPANNQLAAINILHDKLRLLEGSFDGVGDAAKQVAIQNITDQIGKLSGATEKIQHLKDEILGLSQTEQGVRDLGKAGATNEQVAEFRRLSVEAERLKRLRPLAEDLVDQTRTPVEKFHKQLDDLHDMQRRGLIDQETFGRAQELAQKQFAKDESKDEQKHERHSPLQAMLRDSQEAALAIARGMQGGQKANPNAKVESNQEKQLRAQAEANKYLAELAERDEHNVELVDL